MKTLSGNEIRRSFLNYFKDKGHTVVPSSSLIPSNDPTLLFTNAGMVQFKGVFTGEAQQNFRRAVTSQKCIRAGGKHNDLENVGRTSRHHTFFEMLGNFSFGDYFKKDAIIFAWEFLTEITCLSKDRLWVTVFRDDDEAEALWHEVIGIPRERIIRLDEKDNFWQMGDTGPCGPCSEILIDQGSEVGCGSPDCKVGCDCDRFLEIWNLVFMQYNRDQHGCLTTLPAPSIDTGMGLERIAAVVQGKKSNYDSDIFQGLISKICDIAQVTYGSDPNSDISIRVIADHSRAVTFMACDGIVPSNEGRGYVLRRIVRRAARHGKMLGISEPFLSDVSVKVSEIMRESYPELHSQIDFITRVIRTEEERFAETLENGLALLENEVKKITAEGRKTIPGEVVFKLYDTYGFPVDLTEDIVRSKDINLDMKGFEDEMAVQKQRARTSWKGDAEDRQRDVYREILSHLGGVHSTCYDSLSANSRVVNIINKGSLADSAFTGDSIEVVTEETPYYGESGGQTGDTGIIRNDSFSMEVTETIKPIEKLIVHKGKVAKGEVRRGDIVHLVVDRDHRASTALNHTATHLLQATLRSVLGGHVRQAGSSVSRERLRFDFSHFSALTGDEIRKVEEMVNEKVRDNLAVSTDIMTPKDAEKEGATALFGEKYGEFVRVVTAGDFSKELCGGTHAERTGDIGVFKITSESGIASGIRRIEALTGESAYRYFLAMEDNLTEAALMMKTRPENLLDRLSKLIKKEKELEKTIMSLQSGASGGMAESLLKNVREIKGIRVLTAHVQISEPKAMKDMADNLKDKMKSGIIVLGANDNGKAVIVAAVTHDLTKSYHAGNIVKKAAGILGGNGGGRPDMAQAGGPDASKLNDALDAVHEMI